MSTSGTRMASSSSSSAKNGKEVKKVCIVGSGIAGLSMGYFLKSEYSKRYDFHVTILEAAPCIGMDSSSKSAFGARIDIPLRVFSKEYYPNMVRLYEAVGVEYDWANYEMHVRSVNETRPHFRYKNIKNRVLQWIFGTDVLSLPALWSLRIFSLKFFRLGWELFTFGKAAKRYLVSGQGHGLSLREFLLKENFSKDFQELLLLPMYSVFCTCPFEDVLNYPCEIILDYFVAGGNSVGTSQLRAYNGTHDVVHRLTENVDRILCSSEVLNVEDHHSKVKVTWITTIGTESNEKNNNFSQEQVEIFDHVIMATQGYITRKILGKGITQLEAEALDGIPYHANRSVLHTDTRLLPEYAIDYSTCALNLRPDRSESECMIWMNRVDGRLNSALSKNVFQTWNPIREPAPDCLVVDATFQRPLVTLESAKAIEKLHEAQGKRNIWFIGAYSLFSMPLLENGVRSSIRIANQLGVEWEEIGRQIHGEGFRKRYPWLVAKNTEDNLDGFTVHIVGGPRTLLVSSALVLIVLSKYCTKYLNL